jgi:hypothetical protein
MELVGVWDGFVLRSAVGGRGSDGSVTPGAPHSLVFHYRGSRPRLRLLASSPVEGPVELIVQMPDHEHRWRPLSDPLPEFLVAVPTIAGPPPVPIVVDSKTAEELGALGYLQ